MMRFCVLLEFWRLMLVALDKITVSADFRQAGMLNSVSV